MSEESAHTRLTELLDRAEDSGALEFGQVAHAVEEMGLDEDRIEAIYQEAVRRGIALADDWKRDEAPEGAYTPDLFAEATSDSLQIFLRDISQRRLLTRNGEAPGWSRDGKQVAFMREEKCGEAECKERVFLVFADGNEPRPVGPRFPAGHRLLWLPDPNE